MLPLRRSVPQARWRLSRGFGARPVLSRPLGDMDAPEQDRRPKALPAKELMVGAPRFELGTPSPPD